MSDIPANTRLATIQCEAVIFDWDGTLANTRPAHYRALCESMAPFGISVDPQWHLERNGMSTAETIEALIETHGSRPAVTVPDLVERCEGHYCDFLDLVTEITWVADFARSLRKVKPTAVASGGMRGSITAAMEHLGLTGLFDTVVAREDAAEGKPSPEIFLIAAKRLNVAPRQCLVLEDSASGILAAWRAGMSAIDVRAYEPSTGHGTTPQ